MPSFLRSLLVSLVFVLTCMYAGSFVHPYAYRFSWYPKKWRPALYTGQSSLPLDQGPDLYKACQEQCRNTGLQLRRQAQEGEEVKIVTPTAYTRCPASGLNYLVINAGDFIVVCPHQAHEQVVFWDSRCNQVLTQWKTPSTLDDRGRLIDSILHAYVAMINYDYPTCLQECDKVKAMDKPHLDGLAYQAYMASGQAEQALKLCDQILKTKADQEDEWLQNRYNCLLSLNRAAEVLNGKPGQIEKCIAQLETMQLQEASLTLQIIEEQQLFKAYALMALKRWSEAKKQCVAFIHDKGWQEEYAGNAIVVGVLCDWFSHSPEEDTRKFLLQGLNNAPKTWPYPLLRYLNRELCEEELLNIAQSDLSQRIEARFTIGLDLLSHHSDQTHARNLLKEIEPYGHFFEAMTAIVLLKSL